MRHSIVSHVRPARRRATTALAVLALLAAACEADDPTIEPPDEAGDEQDADEAGDEQDADEPAAEEEDATGAPDGIDDEDAAGAAAGWLAGQLVDGERMETEFDGDVFDDHGLTADVVLALASAEVGADAIEAATDWLVDEADAYTGAEHGVVSVGAVAKLLLVLETTGRDEAIDELDLVATVEGREQDDGRYTDEAEEDFSATISQSLAVLSLTHLEGADPSTTAVEYLADQACDDGGFPQQLRDLDDDAAECDSQVDATGFAVQALTSASEDVDDAETWLLEQQDDDGGFTGTEGSANANSTGLAALALAATGEDETADDARDFLLGLQSGCDETEPGSLRYDTSDEPDTERVRATAQALPALTLTPFDEIDAAEADADAPAPACPADDATDDGAGDDTGADTDGR